MHIHRQAPLVESGAGGGRVGGVSKCSPPADFKLPATAKKQRSPHDEGLYIYIYIYIDMCVCLCK